MVLWEDIVGYVGGAILALCIVPQLLKLWRSKSSRDISWAFTILYIIGLVMTLIYLWSKGAIATFACVVVQIIGGLFMLGLKVGLECLPGKQTSSRPAAIGQQMNGNKDTVLAVA